MSGLSEQDRTWIAQEMRDVIGDGYIPVHYYDVSAGIAAQVERIVAAREAAVLRDAADAWTQGAWSDVMLPKPTPPAVPVIAYANRMGDWLRDRAREIGGA